MTHCTWSNCRSLGCKPQIGKDGRQWALLCIAHDMQLKRELEEANVRTLMGSWVKAQGGAEAAEAAAAAMQPSKDAAVKLLKMMRRN
jgi:hypothetical protein